VKGAPRNSFLWKSASLPLYFSSFCFRCGLPHYFLSPATLMQSSCLRFDSSSSKFLHSWHFFLGFLSFLHSRQDSFPYVNYEEFLWAARVFVPWFDLAGNFCSFFGT